MIDQPQTDDDIVTLVQDAANQLAQIVGDLKGLSPIQKTIAIITAGGFEHAAAVKMAAAIRQDQAFSVFRNGYLRYLGGARMIQDHALHTFLIAEVMGGEAAEKVVAQARELATARTSTTIFYLPIAGAAISQTIALEPGITIVPWSNVPASQTKAMFDPAGRPELLAGGLPRFQVAPSGAIRLETSERIILFSDSCQSDAENNAEFARWEALAFDVIRCVAALTVNPVAILGSWTEFGNVAINKMVELGHSVHESLLSMHTSPAKDIGENAGNRLANLFKCFGQFPRQEKAALRIALDRLNQACRRFSFVDKAIDLGIALEAMLLHGLSASDRGELKFRQAVRGALFLCETTEERRKMFDLLRNVYDLRSRAVHTGIFDASQKIRGEMPADVLMSGAQACARIAIKLIERRGFPDWDSECVLGIQAQ